jgi:pimeloyl-ACP methyl ester carboxylesterase
MTGDPAHQQAADRRSAAPMPGRSNQERQPGQDGAWHAGRRGEQAVQFLADRDRLESFEAEDLAGLADALTGRAMPRVETTATAALAGGDVDGAFVAAYDAYRMSAEAIPARQALRASGGDGSHMAVEDATPVRQLYDWTAKRLVAGLFDEVVPAHIAVCLADLVPALRAALRVEHSSHAVGKRGEHCWPPY